MVPIVFGQAVLDADDRISIDPTAAGGRSFARLSKRLASEMIAAVAAEVARRHVDRQARRRPGLEAGIADRLHGIVEELLRVFPPAAPARPSSAVSQRMWYFFRINRTAA